MPAGYNNIIIETGSTFSLSMQVTDANNIPLNLAGYTGSGKVRRSYTSDSFVYDLTVGVPGASGATGTIEISATATATAAMRPGRYVYSVDITYGSLVRRIVQGNADIRPNAND